MGIYLLVRAKTGSVRGAVIGSAQSEPHRPGRLDGADHAVPVLPDRDHRASTRSTPRTCRAGRSTGCRRSGSRPTWHNADMRDALVLSLKAAAISTGDRAGARLDGRLRGAPLPLLRARGDLVRVRAADRPAGHHHRHGAELVLQQPRARLLADDDRDRPRHLLHRHRLQQRARPAAADADLARGGVDGPRRRRLADVPPRHAAGDRHRARRRRSAGLRALLRRGRRHHVHRRRAEHAADLDLRQHPPGPGSCRR